VPVAYREIGINNGKRFASAVTFVAQADTTYYAKVTASPKKDPRTGAMGSYGLLVTLGAPLP
jgi:hypothetical protein